MLHIILFILKIIGIILLCIIGVIILSLFCVLCVPVRYRIEITREEGEEQPPVAVRVKVTWLLHLLNILIRYPAEVIVRVRLMIFTIFKMPDQKTSEEQEKGKENKTKQKKTKDKKAKENKAKENKAKENRPKEDKDEAEAKEIKDIKISDSNDQKKEKNVRESKEKIPTVTIQATKVEDSSPSFMDKLRALPAILKKIFEKFKSLFENIQYTIQSFCDKIKSVSDNIQYYKAVVESDIFQNSFGLCKGELVAILKSLKPQKFEAKMIVGMDDPAVTGQILSICGMLYPILGGHVEVAGDFERKRIEGQVLIKGKIRFFTFLRAAVRIYFNKDIKRLIKLLKKEAV